jgi:hypothetical protein
MAEFIIAIDHITYYVVQAEDEVTAIDLVLEGEGKRFPPRRAMPILASMSAATRDHTRDPRGGPCVGSGDVDGDTTGVCLHRRS